MIELITRRNKLMADLDSIIKAANTEKRDMSPEEQSSFDKMTADVDALDAQIERQKKYATLTERSTASVNVPVAESGTVTPGNEHRAAFVQYLRTGEARALTVGTDANGGYLAPKELSSHLIKNVVEKSPVRSMATVITTSGRSIQFVKRTGTPTGAWVAEGGAAGSTQSAYGVMEIPLHMARVYTDVSMELVNDTAFDIEQQIVSDLAEEFARLEGNALVVGNGSGKPSGFAGSASGITASISGSSGDFDADDLVDLLYGLKATYLQNATWAFSKTVLKKVRKMKANGEYIWSPGGLGNVNNITQGLAPTLLDRPYLVVPDMPATGDADALSIAVGDFKAGYRVVTNPGGGLQILRDNFTQAANGLVRFHAFYRVGGAVVLPEAIALMQESAS